MADFQQHLAEFTARGVKIVGASVDGEDEAKKTIERTKLTFPIAYGMDAKNFSAQTGAFFEPEKGYLHAAGFILAPDGKVAAAVYSTGPVGRYVAADCLGLVEYFKKH